MNLAIYMMDTYGVFLCSEHLCSVLETRGSNKVCERLHIFRAQSEFRERDEEGKQELYQEPSGRLS